MNEYGASTYNNSSICHERVICSSQFVTNESYVAQVCHEQSHPSNEYGASTYNKFILGGAFVHYLDVTVRDRLELHMTRSWQKNLANTSRFVVHLKWRLRSLLGCDCSWQTWATYDSFVTNCRRFVVWAASAGIYVSRMSHLHMTTCHSFVTGEALTYD